VDASRESVSGVNLDEEMTNMLQFQHAYSAAARMITAIDESLDTLINRTGRVGL
jgi:flagellar hook-associated protein 1 FlgK